MQSLACVPGLADGLRVEANERMLGLGVEEFDDAVVDEYNVMAFRYSLARTLSKVLGLLRTWHLDEPTLHDDMFEYLLRLIKAGDAKYRAQQQQDSGELMRFLFDHLEVIAPNTLNKFFKFEVNDVVINDGADDKVHASVVPSIQVYPRSTLQGAVNFVMDRPASDAKSNETRSYYQAKTSPAFLILNVIRFKSETNRDDTPMRMDRTVTFGSAPGSPVYELISFVEHFGKTINNGHYTATGLVNGQMTKFNDRIVTTIDVATNPTVSRGSYIVILRRTR
jgi:uncharacterized UBP type Zn finger protein